MEELRFRQEDQVLNNNTPHFNTSTNDSIIQSPFIYKIRHFHIKTTEELCSTSHTGLLYIDRIDCRLKDINDIPFLDQLYLYKACLQGFKILYEKVGYFAIKEDMIFINKMGQVKVWINPNLAKNQPNYELDRTYDLGMT
jgi:hypothetical protein